MSKYGNKIDDPVFYNLANSIKAILEENNNGKKISPREFTEIQKNQVERMMFLEKEFKKSILKYKQSDKIYKRFVTFIKIENGNILTARPYFRERHHTFGKLISPAFKEEDIEELKKFDINTKFMEFTMENWNGPFPQKAKKCFVEHSSIRQKIIENSMPLAINRAMIFYRSVPRTHVTLIDFVNTCVAGLAIGVDKWVGPFSKVFRSSCIGRMVNGMLELYNQTFIHYYPSDKKIIYKANMLMFRNGLEDKDEILEAINQYLEESGDNRSLDKDELNNLLNGTFILSTDSTHDDENGFSLQEVCSDEETHVENAAEKIDLLKNLIFATEEINNIERKIIRLKGVNI